MNCWTRFAPSISDFEKGEGGVAREANEAEDTSTSGGKSWAMTLLVEAKGI
jgi:hypothetical protein